MQMKTHIVVINQIPPGNANIVLPAPSILKNYLGCHHLTANVIDWNSRLAELQNLFVWGNTSNTGNDDNSLLLFYNYLAWKYKDEKAVVNIKARLMSLKPNHATSEVAFYNKHMKVLAQKLEEAISDYLTEIYSDEIVCFFFFIDSQYKWICASIIAERIKQQYPESVIVVGGLEYKNQAVEYLRMFSQFDFAIWGDTEKAMVDLCKKLTEENKACCDIPQLAFRHENKVITSSCKEKCCVSLAEQSLRPDYSDLIEQVQSNDIAVSPCVSVLGLEVNRQSRYKPVRTIIDEIIYFIIEYHATAFHFTAYELTDNNCSHFYELLDALILVKEQYPDFSISLFPVVARIVSPAALRKMMMAGFYSIQIEYVSGSENLLNKYEAKSTFADNLLLVKFASLYNITLTETDVIIGIPEEADEDILQAISNLYYLRFFFKSGLLRHQLRKMEVMRYSKFYKQAKADKKNWDINPSFKRFLPSDYLRSAGKDEVLLSLMPIRSNPLWDDFKQAESYFMQNRFEYKIYRKANHTILYKELFNNNVINEFELDEMDWFILESANRQVIGIEFLLKEIKDKIKKEFMEIEIINTLENLRFEKLLYLSDDYNEIVSVINTELVV